MENSFQHSTVEALILASPEPLPARKIADMLDEMTPSKVAQAVAELNNRYTEMGCSFRIREVAGGFQMYIVPEFTGFVKEMFARRRKMRLTRAALETLAIIAYRQPVTRVDVEQIRGVASDGVIHNLLEKNMITVRGRAETVGKPLQYGTTDEFLKFFGLASLTDLPKMSEIEELLSSEEPKSQTELGLEDENGNGNGDASHKLNIADGTFDPRRRIEIDDETEAPVVIAPEPIENAPEIEEEPQPPESPADSDQARDDGSGIIVDIDTT